MKVLLTGATGFLGKRTLELLIGDERISTIYAASRTKRSHPHPKVKVLNLDLTNPACVNEIPEDLDRVIHLAGLYDFTQSMASNYSHNVMGTLNILSRLRELRAKREIPILFASTYAVGLGHSGSLREEPLASLPPHKASYPYTKAIAEQAVVDSGLPCLVFRLGVLVGDAGTGEIEKIDGPYYFLNLLLKIRSIPGAKLARLIPLPGDPRSLLPLVPVDRAARALHEGLFLQPGSGANAKIFGVYSTDSVLVRDFCDSALKRYLPGSRPIFLKSVPRKALLVQERLTGIPADLFRFSMGSIRLHNSSFLESFPSCTIPLFGEFEEAFFSGFEAFVGKAVK